MLRWLMTVVVSDEEKAHVMRQVGIREGERERTADEVSKQEDDIETGAVKSSRDEPGGCPFIGQAVSGMKVARARSAAPAWNVGRRVPILPAAAELGWARGSAPTAETGGTEYRCGVVLADRLVVVVKLL